MFGQTRNESFPRTGYALEKMINSGFGLLRLPLPKECRGLGTQGVQLG